MNYEEILKLSNEEKIKKLSKLVENDVNYWKKVQLLISIEGEDTEFLDFILDNKRREIELLKEKYCIKNDIKIEQIKEIIKGKNFSNAMEEIINNTQNERYTRACAYVLEILNRIPKEYYKLINTNFIIELQKRTKGVNLEIDFNKIDLEKNIPEEAKEVLALINSKFWNR